MNLFTIPANDQSVYYLGMIFGPVGTILQPSTGSGAPASLIMGTLFRTFNTTMLVLGSFIIVYTTVVGLLATAHEGEFMGKKWSGLWVPLRSVFGIAALFPTASGYSSLQVVMMWVILQGVGMADQLWNTALNYVQTTGSVYNPPTGPDATVVTPAMRTLFQGLVCQASARVTNAGGLKYSGDVLYYCSDPAHQTEPFCTTDVLNINNALSQPGVYKMGPSGTCGSVTYCASNASSPECSGTTDRNQILMCGACVAQQNALQQVVTLLGGIATNFVNTDLSYVSFNVVMTPKAPDWIQNYCNPMGISSDNCCIYGFPGQTCSSDSFPKWVDSSTGSNDKTNTSTDAIKNLYWPYQLQASLQGINFISAATNYYVSSIQQGIASAIPSLPPPASDAGWTNQASSNGWILGGAFFYKLAQVGSSSASAANPVFTVQGNDPRLVQNAMSGYRNNYWASQSFIQTVLQGTGTGTISGGGQGSFSNMLPAQMSTIGSDLDAGANGIMNGWMTNLTGNSGGTVTLNPLINLANFGQKLLYTAESLFAAFVIGTFVAVWAGGLTPSAFGNFLITGLSPAISAVILLFLPILSGVLGFLFTFGGLLSVYVPLIPYIIFTMTAIGWIIATIEAMVASPLVAIGILSPGGQHEILGRAEPAIMLLLNVLLRPSLMIFGLIVSIFFSVVIVMFINNTFSYAMSQIAGNPSFATLILFMAAYVFLIITALNKCFTLIHLIPERVMTWIGGQAVSYGETEAMGEIKRGTEAAGGAVAGGAQAAVGKVSGRSRKKTGGGGGQAQGQNNQVDAAPGGEPPDADG